MPKSYGTVVEGVSSFIYIVYVYQARLRPLSLLTIAVANVGWDHCGLSVAFFV